VQASPELSDLVRRLYGALTSGAFPRQPNYLELALRVEPYGLSTGVLPGGGVALLDFARTAVVYTPARGERVTIPLSGHSQGSLLEALLIAMDLRGEGLVPRPEDQWSHTQELRC
jgi:hypothetical protein